MLAQGSRPQLKATLDNMKNRMTRTVGLLLLCVVAFPSGSLAAKSYVVTPEAEWEEVTLTVEPGERLLMVTDGVTEMFNAKGECFGRTRLSEAFSASADRDVDEAAKYMRMALAGFRRGHPCHDDVTLVLAEFSH